MQGHTLSLAARWLALAALCGTLAGCGAMRRITAPRRPDVMPTPEQLQARLDARRQVVHSMRALGRLHYRDAEGTNTSREALVVERPDRLRVEVLSLFGAVFVLTARDGSFTAYARGDDTIYRGAASPKRMWRYARIGLPVPDLVDLVLGTPPQRPATWASVSWDADTGWIQLSQDLESGAFVVWFEDELPRAAEMRDAYGEVQWRALFGKYSDIDGIMIATRIKLEVPDEDHSVKIELDDIDVNPEIPEDTFSIPASAGANIVDLDEASPETNRPR